MDWSFYDPFKGQEPHKPFSEKCYCIFEVLDAGTWYRIDTTCMRPELYSDVPESVVMRARTAIRNSDYNGDYRVDPAPYDEAALRAEFDDVRFLGTDFVPGVVC